MMYYKCNGKNMMIVLEDQDWRGCDCRHTMAFLIYLMFSFCLLRSCVDAWIYQNTYLTYNTALLDFALLPGVVTNTRTQRRDAIIDALIKSPADVVCLQEVWIGQDIEAIVNGVSAKFPYSFSAIHGVDGTLPPQATAVQDPACNFTLVQTFGQCAISKGCSVLPVVQQGACAVANCRTEFGAIFESPAGGTCITCLFSSLYNPVNETVAKCTAPGPDVGLRTMNRPGLLVLSNRRLSAMSYTRYHQQPALIERGYLEFTQIRRKLKVVCTHLTTSSDLGFTEPVLSQIFPTLQAQNLFEVETLVTAFKKVCPIIVLGDMNVGASRPPNVTEFDPANYYTLLDEFKVTYVSVECTFCYGTENIYNSNQDEENSVIDHVMSKGMIMTSGQRVLTTVENNITDSGQVVPLSDHFGYMCNAAYSRWLNHWMPGLCP